TSQDADIGAGDDGSYWTWTRREVEAALGGDKRLVRAAVLRYGLDDPMSALPSDHERHVLHLALEVDEAARRLEVEPGGATSRPGSWPRPASSAARTRAGPRSARWTESGTKPSTPRTAPRTASATAMRPAAPSASSRTRRSSSRRSWTPTSGASAPSTSIGPG